MARSREKCRLRTEALEGRRMLAAGDLDTTFNGIGRNTVPVVTNQDDLSTTMAVQPWDGAIVLAGDTFPPGQKALADNALARILPSGAVDNSFGTIGRVTAAVGTGTDHISGIAFQFTDATTKYLIVAGYSLVSFNDLSFAQDPQNGNLVVTSASRLFQRADIGATLAITGGQNWTTGNYTITNITIDNRAILDRNPSTSGINVTGGQWTLNNYDFVVSRYFADTPPNGPAEGTLDLSFGPVGTGHAIYPVGPRNDFGYAVKVQPWDQKIVVVGYSVSIQGVYDFSVMRLTPQGILDTAGFNATGLVPGVGLFTIQDNDYANALDFDLATNSILMAGSAGGTINRQGDPAFIRLTEAGTLDTTFDTDGKLWLNTNGGIAASTINSVKIYQAGTQAGKIIATGTQFGVGTNYNPIVVRLTATGAFDLTFNSSGVVKPDIPSTLFDWGNSIDVQANNKVVIAGSTGTEGLYNVYLMRFNDNGSPDNTFSADGKNFVITDLNTINPSNDFGATVEIVDNGVNAPNEGKIYVGGSTFNKATSPNNYDFLILRYKGDSTGVKPVLSLLDRSMVEGDGGTIAAEFTIRLSQPLTTPITVQYSTQDGTAKAGVDYVGKSGVAVIPAGSTSTTITIDVPGNTTYQAIRWLSLLISADDRVTISNGQGRLTIRDNDGTWQNVVDPEDVNKDGDVEPVDVLNIIDDVNRNGVRQLARAAGTPSYFFDVTGDTWLTPQDVLAVIDRLNRSPSTASGLTSSRNYSESALYASSGSAEASADASAIAAAIAINGSSQTSDGTVLDALGSSAGAPSATGGTLNVGGANGSFDDTIVGYCPVTPPWQDETSMPDWDDMGEDAAADDELFELLAGSQLGE